MIQKVQKHGICKLENQNNKLKEAKRIHRIGGSLLNQYTDQLNNENALTSNHKMTPMLFHGAIVRVKVNMLIFSGSSCD